MRAFTVFGALLLCFVTFAAAWPWPRFLPEVDSLVVRRQNGGDNEDSDTSVARPTQTSSPATDEEDSAEETGSMTITSAPSRTSSPSNSDDDEDNTSDSNDDEETESGSRSSSRRSSKSATSTKRKVFDPRLPPGGVTMLQPAATDPALPVYAIGSNITFAFSLTSCMSYPTAVNIKATCTGNAAAYTIASNSSIKEGADKTVFWDTGRYGNQNPLLTDEYSLVIWDADAEDGEKQRAEAGYLATWTGLKFSLYERGYYEDEPEGPPKCITCSGGVVETAAMGLVMGVGLGVVALVM